MLAIQFLWMTGTVNNFPLKITFICVSSKRQQQQQPRNWFNELRDRNPQTKRKIIQHLICMKSFLVEIINLWSKLFTIYSPLKFHSPGKFIRISISVLFRVSKKFYKKQMFRIKVGYCIRVSFISNVFQLLENPNAETFTNFL